MIEAEEYTKFIHEAFAGIGPRIRLGNGVDFSITFPTVQIHVGPSYMSYETVFTYSQVARMVIFVPVRFGNGWFSVKDWADTVHIDDPEKFHKQVYEFIRDLKEYEKREKILKMKLETRKYAC